MGRKSLGIKDYKELAKSKELEFAEDQAPYLTKYTVSWRCKRCGRVLKRSYNTLKYSASACICRTSLPLSDSEYKKLARQLGLEWRGEFAVNVREMTRWYSEKLKVEFDASYHQLAYGKIPKSLLRYIGGNN